MSIFFAYVRVSTVRQGERGVSLQEQKDAISAHARRHGLEIAQWFEERETAAKRGRAVFAQMLRLLQKGKATGVIMHKIDRSARNLRDWAELGELIDRGIVVHFANENLDLDSRGGRLSADIQAVVAADFIRNLREETKKGFYGRLKQGLYPLPAPLGYLDCGKGKRKEIDAEKAPLVANVFEIYATGNVNLKELVERTYELGLRNRRGGKVAKSSLADMLSNPFYIGIIRTKKSGEMFKGIHEPIVSKSVFDVVQAVLQGKSARRTYKHDYLFRRLLRCKSCAYLLIGESQKGNVYYRCHTYRCPTTSVREDFVDRALRHKMLDLRVVPEDEQKLLQWAEAFDNGSESEKANQRHGLELSLERSKERLLRLTDAFLDGAIDRAVFDNRKNALLVEQAGLEERLHNFDEPGLSFVKKMSQYLELARTLFFLYGLAIPEKKRVLVKSFTSNRYVLGKELEITCLPRYKPLAERPKTRNGVPYRVTPRTYEEILKQLRADNQEKEDYC
jgi:DNA invertase Pin-like site-specific DNA recombinase